MGTAATIHCVLLNADRSNECWTTAVVMTCRPVTMLRQQVLTWQRRHCGSEVELHIGNLGKQRSWSAALAIVLETLPLDVVAAGAGTSVCDQAVACYGAAVMGCARGSRLDLALALVDQVQGAKLQLGMRVYNYLLTRLAWRHQHTQVALLIDRMWRLGPHPTVASFQTLINACAGQGWWERALMHLRNMRAARVTPDVMSFS